MPAGLWFWLAGARTTRERVLRLPAMGAVVLAVGVVAFAPFWRGPATITVPLRSLSGMNPGGSIAEVVGDLVHVLRGGADRPPDMPVLQALAHDRATHGATWFVTSLVLRVVTLAIGARVLHAIARRPADDGAIALGTGVLLVAIATLASHRFEPWYLLAALPFFGLRCTAAWRRWWVAAAGLVVAPTFINVLPRTTALLPVWSVVSMAGVMYLFLRSLRARYVTLRRAGGAGRRREPALSVAGAR